MKRCLTSLLSKGMQIDNNELPFLPIKLSIKKPDDISDWGTDIYAY